MGRDKERTERRESLDEKRRDLARYGFLSMGMNGCLNNLTGEEKRKIDQFLDDPANAERVDFGNGRIMVHPIAISRMREATKERGTPEPIQTTCCLWWGKGTILIEPERLENIFKQMMKGGD